LLGGRARGAEGVVVHERVAGRGGGGGGLDGSRCGRCSHTIRVAIPPLLAMRALQLHSSSCNPAFT
jgi:hypothetical protein